MKCQCHSVEEDGICEMHIVTQIRHPGHVLGTGISYLAATVRSFFLIIDSLSVWVFQHSFKHGLHTMVIYTETLS